MDRAASAPRAATTREDLRPAAPGAPPGSAPPSSTRADEPGAAGRHAASLGLAAVGGVLVAATWTPDASALLYWYALPAAVLAMGAAVLFHQFKVHNSWRDAHRTRIAQQAAVRAQALDAAASLRAAALADRNMQGLDYRALAMRNAQIGLWVVDVTRATITLEGLHVGSRDFLPETRIYQGRGWFERLHPQEQALVEHRFKEFIKGLLPEFEMEYRAPDERGGWRWVLARGLVVDRDDQGRVLRAAGTHTDIHQRKLAQIAHAQERSLFNAGPLVLWRFSLAPAWRIDFMSRNVARLWQHADPDWTAVGQSAGSLVHPDDWAGVQEEIMQALGRGERGHDSQLRLAMGDGQWRWHGMRVVFEQDRAGERHARGCLIDIDERKALEASAAEHRQKLEALVQQLHMTQADSVVLQDTSDLLNSADDVDEAFEIVRRAADAVFPGWSGALSAIMPHGNLAFVGQWGDPPEQEREFDLKDCWGLRRGKPHGFLSAERQLCCRHIRPGASGRLLPYVCVPMSANGETVGALHLFANSRVTPQALADIEARADRFCETLKLALSNLRLRAWLRDQATRDGLTGLYNRRLLDERLPIEIKRSQRERQPVALAMVDVDHFKQFNDQYGHDAGDLVLKTLSELLLERVRVYDLACRYGGEEMVLLMPGCPLDDAIVKLETIRSDIAQLSILHQGRALPAVTVSIGLAHAWAGSADALMRRADEALYAAKHQGRNRLVVHAPGGPPDEQPRSEREAAP